MSVIIHHCLDDAPLPIARGSTQLLQEPLLPLHLLLYVIGKLTEHVVVTMRNTGLHLTTTLLRIELTTQLGTLNCVDAETNWSVVMTPSRLQILPGLLQLLELSQ